MDFLILNKKPNKVINAASQGPKKEEEIPTLNDWLFLEPFVVHRIPTKEKNAQKPENSLLSFLQSKATRRGEESKEKEKEKESDKMSSFHKGARILV